MNADTQSIGEYLLAQCKSYVNFPPNDAFSLGRMSQILELTNMMGYGSSDTFASARKLFSDLAPKINAKGKKK